MRDVLEPAIGWLVIAGIVLAVFLGKRRGEQRLAARLEAAAEGGRAEIRAELGQHVNVAVDASHVSGAGVHECLDPWSCAVCAPLLFRAVRVDRDRVAADLGRSRLGLASGVNDDHHHDNHHDDDGRRLVERTGRGAGFFVSDNGGSATGDRDVVGDVGACFGLEGVPDPALRPELIADMSRRPWAYDEADPRFDRGVPVARGRGGRGPGR